MRNLLKSKRKEIDSALSLINKVKSAFSVGDIDSKVHPYMHISNGLVCSLVIFKSSVFLNDNSFTPHVIHSVACKQIRNMEHMIQHETLPLKEEKSYIREIKQLKQTREQLSSSLGSQEDIQEAIDQKDQVEERLKVLIFWFLTSLRSCIIKYQ